MNKEITTAIKGIAILLMVSHHCFGFPEWYIDSVSYPDFLPYSREFANITNICVSIFAVLTGWVYFKHLDKSFLYSLKKNCKFSS